MRNVNEMTPDELREWADLVPASYGSFGETAAAIACRLAETLERLAEVERERDEVTRRLLKGLEREKRISGLAATYSDSVAASIKRAHAAEAKAERLLNGSRPLPADRDTLGRLVREAWVRWAQAQPAPKPSWLVPYNELSEPDKEADRQIGEAIARWTLIHDSARAALTEGERTS